MINKTQVLSLIGVFRYTPSTHQKISCFPERSLLRQVLYSSFPYSSSGRQSHRYQVHQPQWSLQSFREIVGRNSFQVEPGNELFYTFGLSKDLGRILEVK